MQQNVKNTKIQRISIMYIKYIQHSENKKNDHHLRHVYICFMNLFILCSSYISISSQSKSCIHLCFCYCSLSCISLHSWSFLSCISWCSRCACNIFFISTHFASNSLISFCLVVPTTSIFALVFSSSRVRSIDTDAEDDEATSLTMRPNPWACPVFFPRTLISIYV